MRYFIEITYNGKNYCGWQMQPNALSVQQVLEQTLSLLLRKKIKVTGAGRTDAGVHAKQLFAHFDCEELENVDELIFRINSFLPQEMAVRDIFMVKNDAHARFDALERTYQYIVSVGKNPFLQEFAYQINYSPNIELMNNAAKILLEHNDFECFSRSKTDVKTYNCTIVKAFWETSDNKLIFTIAADRFLRNMVRAIVGTLLDVGQGKKNLKEFIQILESKNRSTAGASAPAHGLYLIEILYPQTIFIDKI